MKKFFIPILLSATLGACGDADSRIICGEYDVALSVSDDGEILTAVINDSETTLTHAISASGARYVGELNGVAITLWNQGTDWTMFLNDGAPIECSVK